MAAPTVADRSVRTDLPNRVQITAMPTNPEAIRRTADRLARQTAALRANLSRRKDQQRQQDADAKPAGAPDTDPPRTAPKTPVEPGLAPDHPRR